MEKMNFLLLLMMSCALFSCKETEKKTEDLIVDSEEKILETREAWSTERANEWFNKQSWLVGANYNPRTAINELEM